MTETINTFGRLLQRAAKQWPDAPALILPDEVESFGDLYHRAEEVARGLIALGVQAGDHVGILLPTGSAFMDTMFGVSLAGAVQVPINGRYRAAELSYITENADMVTIVTTGQVAEGVNFIDRLTEGLPELESQKDARHLKLKSAPKLRNIVVLGGGETDAMVGETAFRKLAQDVPREEVNKRRDGVKDEDLAVILYTSGTTSNPKGCMLTNASIIGNGRACAKSYEVKEGDRFWSPLPMFHIAATLPIAGCVELGAAYITMSYFDAGVALGLLEKYKATQTYPCFVTIISDLINHPKFAETDLSSVRVMNANLAVQPPGFAEKLLAAMPNCVHVGTYGLSEASGTVCTSPLDSPLEERVNRLGKPLPGLQVKICDPETGKELPTGARGEICVKGYSILKGYYRSPEKTAETIKDGWLHTGDIGSFDEAGTIMFHGRTKDMLKVGGENVAAAEIESHLQKHPAVKLAQVVGVADPRLVEVPAAFVELQPGASVTEDELTAHCKGQISSFKIPRYYRFVTEWPMSTTKIQKYKLKDDLEAELEAAKSAAE